MKMGFISYVILDFYTVRTLFLSTYFPTRHICSSNILTTVPTNKPLPNIYCITDGKDWSAPDGKNITPPPNNTATPKIVTFLSLIGTCFILLNPIQLTVRTKPLKQPMPQLMVKMLSNE